MVRVDYIRADDIEVDDGELDTDDLNASGCAVFASGAHCPRLPARLPVTFPAPDAPVKSVASLVDDARTLVLENRTPRAQYEVVSTNNAGLATHASVLHDRNLVLLRRARAGYRAGMVMLEQVFLSQVRTEKDNVMLRDRLSGLRDRVARVDAAEAQLRVLKATTAEQYHDLQAQLTAS
ncbi:hypothetical protein PF008_g5326 [Phytophthora fragariae]|uniref:Uncharacterized protein n=1 Tax=Phytophthora fragariae TaxID=53985 RepID=A0A6G0S8P3_9STRA|nr:hypothetical protein PF008_g5326 [Phytophthora fragariae]